MNSRARGSTQIPAFGDRSCQLCGGELETSPRHVVDLDARVLCRACGTCSLLFRLAGAGGGRFRTVPDRILFDPKLLLSDCRWVESTGVPGQLAFVIYCGSRDCWVATFPTPGGLTERELDGEIHERLTELWPLIDELEPDVEALLVRRPPGESDLACYLVPIDVCYELVARLRRSWRGAFGGEAGRRAVDEMFADLAARSRPVIRRQAS